MPIGRPWVLIVNTDEDPAVERQAVETLLEKQVDGLIVVVASASEHPHLESRNLRATPVILVDRCIDQLNLTPVTTDDLNQAQDLPYFDPVSLVCERGSPGVGDR